jgi:hypothetical protein
MTKIYLMNSLIEKVLSNIAISGTGTNSRIDAVPRPGLSVHTIQNASPLSMDIDSSSRFMGLNDLMTEIRQDPASFQGDETVEAKVLNQVLTLVQDKISEVKNQAVKWCAQWLSS